MGQTEETKIAVMQKEISYIKEKVDEVVSKLDNNYVTKDEHNGLEKKVDKIQGIIDRIVWIIITMVLGAVLALVISIK